MKIVHDVLEIASGSPEAGLAVLAAFVASVLLMLVASTWDTRGTTSPARVTLSSVKAAAHRVKELEAETEAVERRKQEQKEKRGRGKARGASPSASKRSSSTGRRGSSSSGAAGALPDLEITGAPLSGSMKAIGLEEMDYDLASRGVKTPLIPLGTWAAHSFLTIVLASLATGAAANYSTLAFACGALGGATLVSSVFFYNASVSMFVWIATISLALIGSSPAVTLEALVPVAVPLLCGWFVSHPWIQQQTGPQINMLLVGAIFGGIMVFFKLPYPIITSVAIAVLSGPMSPVSLDWNKFVVQVGNVVVAAGAAVSIGVATSGEQSTLELASAGVCIAMAAFTFMYWASQRLVWGPFYTHEARSAWTSCLGFLFVVYIISISPSDASAVLRSVHTEALTNLLYLVIGYGVASLYVAGVQLFSEAWTPQDSFGHRLVTFDMFLVVLYFLVPFVIIARNTTAGTAMGGYLATGIHVAGPHFARIVEAASEFLDHKFTQAESLALLIAATRVVAEVFMTFASARNLLWAPMLSIVTWRGNPRTDTVALTFNGGPASSTTERLLEVLDEHDAKVTFFVDADSAVEHAELLQDLAESGHQIAALGSLEGPHTVATVRGDVRRVCRAIEEAVGYKPSSYRPRDGNRDARTIRAVGMEGLAVSLWSVVGWDWGLTEGSVVADEIEAALAPAGDVILMHERLPNCLPARGSVEGSNPNVVRATRELLERLSARNLRSVPLDEVCPPSWEVFRT